MTIQPVTSTHSMNPTFSQSQADKNLAQNTGQLLTPEVLNELNKAQQDQEQAKKDRVQDTFDTAKNIDLARSYYDQQQAVLNAYMQSTENGSANKSTERNDSAVLSLTEMYAALYEHRQATNNLPTQQPVTVQPVNTDGSQNSVAQTIALNTINNEQKTTNQMHAYNNVMMPTDSSYMHLSA